MTSYWVVRQGKGGSNAQEMIESGYLGVDFIGDYDIRPYLGSGSEAFRRALNGVYQELYPGTTKIGAGLAMGRLWTACEGIQEGDVVLAPKPDRTYQFGVVASGYEYHPGSPLPHRRRVDWKGSFGRDEMSPGLASSAGTQQTVLELAAHSAELAQLTRVTDSVPVMEAVIASEVEEQLAFQMEKQLEDFLVSNWRSTVLGRDYDIYEEDGQLAGQQYLTDTGPMDILAVSKDGKRILVIELKRGRASDAVVGQIQRYMGFVQETMLEPGQEVEGLIIALDDDRKIRRALSVAPNIRFMRYRVEFHLEE
ncbi:endonuclease NucS domain-containing protein [Paenarthrobacter sp. C1]|uniref:endonuclease NucS domain-containing protein n=1 Tax=Paenarthrobacter sp. C1 TaxID=3400220 RepID=UPI003BF4C6A2